MKTWRTAGLALCWAIWSSFMISCYCFRGDNSHTKTCAVVEATIDCAKIEAQKISGIEPLVAFILEGAGGAADPIALLASLETVGVDIVACAGQKVADDLAARAAALPPPSDKPGAALEHARVKAKASAVSQNLEAWKAKSLPGVTIKQKGK